MLYPSKIYIFDVKNLVLNKGYNIKDVDAEVFSMQTKVTQVLVGI